MNGHRLRRHSRPKELQSRRISCHIPIHRPSIPHRHPRLIFTRLYRPILTISVSQSSPSSYLYEIHMPLLCVLPFFVQQSFSISSSEWRPRGLPHIRNTLEIVSPQPLTPTSFADHIGYGGVSAVNRRDSRHGTLCRLMGGGSHLAYVITRPPHR
jgi:hypothetical protein